MATFKSFEALEKQLCKEMKSAATSARNKIDKELYANVSDYYSGTSPKSYRRTGTLLTSPQTTEVEGTGKHLEFTAYMDENISYDTGNFSGADVIDATENGYGGTLGRHGYFKRTDEAVPGILESTFSKL